jgi:hypothetical protein
MNIQDTPEGGFQSVGEIVATNNDLFQSDFQVSHRVSSMTCFYQAPSE